MEMDVRSQNYIFISFRWKITVIYCFVACPLNEWFSLCPKVRRRFVGIVFALRLGPVTPFTFSSSYCTFRWRRRTSFKMRLRYCISSFEKKSWQVHKPNEMSIQMSWKAYPNWWRPNKEIHNCTTQTEPNQTEVGQKVSINLYMCSFILFDGSHALAFCANGTGTQSTS